MRFHSRNVDAAQATLFAQVRSVSRTRLPSEHTRFQSQTNLPSLAIWKRSAESLRCLNAHAVQCLIDGARAVLRVAYSMELEIIQLQD
jgi:hypothetical protein